MTVWRVGGEAPGTVVTVRQSGDKAMCPRGSSMADWLGAIGRISGSGDKKVAARGPSGEGCFDATLSLTILQKAEPPR